MTNASVKNVPVQIGRNVLVGKIGRSIVHRRCITEEKIKEIAIEKYKSTGKGITIQDVIERFALKKQQAQRSLKHFHAKGIIFTAEDLINQGIYLIQNTNPQQYFAVCVKADILEDIKKRKNVLVRPTGVSLQKGTLISNQLEYQRAQSFLDVLVLLPFAPLYIHKLQLMVFIDKQYFNEILQKEGHINRAKRYEEIIGRRHVTYTFSPNGSVEIAVRSSDTPFKLETDEDDSIIFSFLGQVKDRLLYHVSDIREQQVPSIMNWVLKACDLNKDITIDEKAQLTLPDIQLKYADMVFRLYVKSLHDKAVYRTEESLTLNHVLLKEALDDIRHPFKSIENDIEQMKNQIDKIEKKVGEMTSE